LGGSLRKTKPAASLL